MLKLLAFLWNNTFILFYFPCKLGPRQGFGFPFELRVMARPVLSPHRSDRSILPWFPASRKRSHYIPVLHIIRSEIIHPEILIDGRSPKGSNGFFSAPCPFNGGFQSIELPISPFFGTSVAQCLLQTWQKLFFTSLQLHATTASSSIQLLQIKLITVERANPIRPASDSRLCWKLQKTLGILAETKFIKIPDRQKAWCPWLSILPLWENTQKMSKLEDSWGLQFSWSTEMHQGKDWTYLNISI